MWKGGSRNRHQRPHWGEPPGRFDFVILHSTISMFHFEFVKSFSWKECAFLAMSVERSTGQECCWGSITVLLRHTFKRQRSTILSRSPIAGPDLASGSTRQQNIIIPLNLVVFHKSCKSKYHNIYKNKHFRPVLFVTNTPFTFFLVLHPLVFLLFCLQFLGSYESLLQKRMKDADDFEWKRGA